MFTFLKPFFSAVFLKFCCVGASGVIVNLGFLKLFSELFGLHVNLSAALAIELSIISNFSVNEIWTFKDRKDVRQRMLTRLGRFHLVSIVGGIVQLAVFVIANYVFFILLKTDASLSHHVATSWFDRWIVAPVLNPPNVGNWIYLSQITGIGVATTWNFMANFYWTWKKGSREVSA